ncbi:MAG: TIR domain-containing protein, partial [Syntrophomonas sp.]
MGECFLYDAFISYRHSIPDSLIAQKLHRALETYKTPSALVKKGAPRKLRKVFRDREELPTSGNLSGDIREALENSEFLIVICSPRTPESKWVMEEIETFKKLGREDKILAILIEGEPDDSFPPALRERSHHCIDADGKDIKQSVEIEPLAADIRASSLKKSLHLLKNEKLRLLAPILKCRFDDLKQRHRERFIRQIAITAVGLVSFLTVFSMFSFYQWKNTEKARDTALRNRSKALAILSQQQTKSNNSTLGVLLALEALPQDLAHPDKPYVAEAEDALYQALVNLRQRCILDAGEGNNFRAASYTPDGQRLVTLDKTHLRFWDVNTGQLLEELDKSYLKNVYFSGRFDYSPGSDYMLPPDGNNTEIWDSKGNIVTDLKERPFCFGSNGEVVTVKEIKPDNKAHHSNKLTRWDVLGNELNSIILPLCQKSIISPNGDYELGFDENATCLRDTHTGQVLIDAGTGGGEYGKFDLSFSPDSRRFAIADNEKKVIHVWDIKEKREIAALAEQAKVTAFSPNGKFLVAKAKNNVGCLWDVDQAQPMMVLGSPQDLIDSAEFSPDGRYVAVVLRDHSVHMWDMSSLHEAFSLARNQELTEVRFSPDGKQFLTLSLGEPKNISLWNMDISNQITLYKSPNGKNGAIYPQFNSNGESIVIEDYSHSIDTRDIYLWDTVTGQKTDLLGGDQTRYYQ